MPGTSSASKDGLHNGPVTFSTTTPTAHSNFMEAMILEQERFDMFGQFGLAELPLFDTSESDSLAHNFGADTNPLQSAVSSTVRLFNTGFCIPT
jgi:hypothetical protein